MLLHPIFALALSVNMPSPITMLRGCGIIPLALVATTEAMAMATMRRRYLACFILFSVYCNKCSTYFSIAQHHITASCQQKKAPDPKAERKMSDGKLEATNCYHYTQRPSSGHLLEWQHLCNTSRLLLHYCTANKCSI